MDDSRPFQLFQKSTSAPAIASSAVVAEEKSIQKVVKQTDTASKCTSFSDLGLAKWCVQTCKEFGMKRPTPVQEHCIPRIIAGDDVLGLAQTGSGKTAAFALPILHCLAEEPYGVFALVITPTRELAEQLADQFCALGAYLHLRLSVVIGGMDMLGQAQNLIQRPHVVIATPGRLKVFIENNPDVPAVFSKTKFLVLDEADRVLDVGFEDELRVVFKTLPRTRQTLLFSATMTSNLQALLELSSNKTYFFEAYEGCKTVESLRQKYIFVPKNVKDLYLIYILSKLQDMDIRSAIIFVATCRGCHRLSLLLEELEVDVVSLHSFKSQSLRRDALKQFKSENVTILIATDVAGRGLDIPTVDLVINYDIPRYPRDYIHRVGRTARAGREGLALSFVTQNEVALVHEIESVIGKQLELYECKEKEVLADITKIYKARRVTSMKMMDDGFDDMVKVRREQKIRDLAAKGIVVKKKRRRRSENESFSFTS